MPIDVYKGKPGAGKSYHGTLTAKEALEGGRPVVTNLPLKADHPFWKEHIDKGNLILVKGRQDVQAHEVDHFGRWAGWRRWSTPDHGLMREVQGKADEAGMVGPLIIVDEAAGTLEWMYRNSKKSEEWADFVNFLRLHRHSRVDVILLYQDYGQVQQDVKSLVERWHDFTNMSEVMGANVYRVRVYSKGYQNNAKAAISEKQRPYKKDVYELYDSFSEGAGQGVKGKTKAIGLRRRLPVWMSPAGVAGGLALLALPFVIWNGVGAVRKMLSTDEPELPVAVLTSPGEPAPAVPVQGGPPDRNPILVRPVGFPSDGPLTGFDNNLLVVDGVAYDLQELNRMHRITVLEASQCLVSLVKRDEAGNVVSIQSYRCGRGF